MIPKRNITQRKIYKIENNKLKPFKDSITFEEPLEIRLIFSSAGKKFTKSISITMRTPGDDFELAAGFLLTEGIIAQQRDIVEMSYCVGTEKELQEYNIVNVTLDPSVKFDPDLLERHFYTTSSCGVCGKASLEALEIKQCPVIPKPTPFIAASEVQQLPQKLRDAQAVFSKTGGIHAAALFSPKGDLLSLREDVGRHNAVDKLIGEQLMARALPLHTHVLFVSGRTSFEIMQKALMAGIQVVGGVGAPSSLAVDLAEEFRMTLLGFVKEDSFNIYANRERIITP